MVTTAKALNIAQDNLSNNVNQKVNQKNRSKLGRYYLASGPNKLVASINAARKIKSVTQELMSLQRNHTEYKKIVEQVVNNLKQTVDSSIKLWKIAQKWVSGQQIVPEDAPLLGSVLNSLCSAKILKAENSKRGTQLKLLLTLEGGQQALFKPQWYKRNEIIRGSVYAGKDRHNAEVAAFHLSLLLNIRRVPLTVGRKINIRREVMPVASQELLNTFFKDKNETCFYGVCLYCEPKSPVCTNDDIMEGALIMWLPTNIKFQRHPNPWQRSYKSDLVARWEVEEDYCHQVKSTKQYNPEISTRLLDLIDSVVFDFLLDNGDRHHYEVPLGLTPSSVFLFDNGKSFGNPFVDHIDILAPIYQCCMIRRETWERLHVFSGGALSSSLEKVLKYSHISPVLTDSHLHALDRRLILIFAAIEVCVRENGASNVFF
ncbi:hypothetical protein RUM44_013369 [Polyplax serrata]|uniref:FAM20 C-terminal domain-containing protein n=1 Tax=Polyplax serrata TaxID=468196 RepID=A0ABR1BHM9_POLSC